MSYFSRLLKTIVSLYAASFFSLGMIPLGMLLVPLCLCAATPSPSSQHNDVVIVGATPSGIMAAISAARRGHSTVLLCRYEHVGGLPSNGLCKTDCFTPDATQGLFREFMKNVKGHYAETYGSDSPQAKACYNGLRFEPSVAEIIFLKMLDEHKDLITVLTNRQFDANPVNVTLDGARITGIRVLNRQTEQKETYRGNVFIDATYEGDLAAAAGAPFRIGREGRNEYDEVSAGIIYRPWRGKYAEESSGLADNGVQSYNYRICLTKDPNDRCPIEKPDSYNRAEYKPLVDLVRNKTFAGKPTRELHLSGIGFIVNLKALPNGKYDANNQHLSFLSTDLPEENWPWPTSSWTWRDQFAERLRDYELGLIWFAQHDNELPEDFRNRCLEWGLSKSEFADNDHFPREVYVREGRRIEGEYTFTLHDCLTKRGSPEHATSITAWHYNADSHAVRKREPGRPHLEGFNVLSTRTCCVPYGVIVPKKVEGLLVPVAASASHVGFRVLRMEPCWMALGQAAGAAAAISIEEKTVPRDVDVLKLQRCLLNDNAVLFFCKDVDPGDPHFEAFQFFALRGFLGKDEWEARLEKRVDGKTASNWIQWAGVGELEDFPNETSTRGELLSHLYERVLQLPAEKIALVQGQAWERK